MNGSLGQRNWQARKGTEIPYVAHLLGVASIAMHHGADEEQAIAALLHDAIEAVARDEMMIPETR